MNTVRIYGSHGELTVDRLTGMVLEYQPDGTEYDYSDIVRFDPADIAREEGGGDILYYGYWTRGGQYEEPLTPRAQFTQQWGWVFEDMQPLRLLPCPTTLNI